MNATSRDDGLVRKVGPWGLAASVVGIVVGAGIFAVPGALAAAVGPYAPFAFLVCGLAIGAVAICFAEGGSRMPTSGGVYGYIEAAFGPLTGYVAGMLLLVGDVLACGGVAAALADVAASVASKSLVPTVHAAVIVGVIGSVALINIAGVARAARFVSVATALKLIPLFIFIIVGCTRIDSANFVLAVQPDTEGLGRAAILALFSFIGMEAPLAASGEVAQPSRTIPRALAIAMVSVALIYVAIQIVAQGVLGASLAHSRAPLADAMGHISPLLRALMLAGAVVSMFGWISSDLLGSPRILFAFARDGLLPRALGVVHPRTRAPYVAILVYAGLAAVLALTGSFAELAALAALTTAALYAVGCVAAWLLARRGVAIAGTPLNFRWLGAATLVGVTSMLALIALGTWIEVVGLATLIGLSALIYLGGRRASLYPS
jgi:APA family basic amino acid/polyamine antiporter